ncbi:Gfo/Idh/MocA family oxidoreductase [Candidatus Poribacteria bacterium]|nr:Gfo/Idh/MocA family oxidoreductase [Candidatus Poribacteria bacterium]
MRIALIGCGRIAPAHLEALGKLADRATVVAICDPRDALRQERMSAYGVPHGFASLDDLLDWGAFDIAACLTPPDTRAAVCLPILSAGKHLLVEKPFTHSEDEARTIVDAAKSSRVTLAVNQNFRWMPPAFELRERILGGEIGDVLSVLLVDAVWRDESEGWRNTTDKLALSVMGVHWLDRIRWVTGLDGTSVYASTSVSGLLSSTGEDISSVVIRLDSGAIATLVHHWASHARGASNTLQIDGTEGSLVVRESRITRSSHHAVQWSEPVPAGHLPDSMAASWTELLDAIREGREPCHSGNDNLKTVALLLGAYRSAETGASWLSNDAATRDHVRDHVKEGEYRCELASRG